MSSKEIDGVNVLLKAVANVDEIIGINKGEVAFDHKPTVHVREEFFLEQFNAYARRPFTEDYDCLFTEIDGVVWHCLVRRCSMNEVIKKISASIHSVKELNEEYGVGIRTIGFCEMPIVLVSDEFFDNNFAEYDKKINPGGVETKRAEIGGITWLTAKVVKE